MEASEKPPVTLNIERPKRSNQCAVVIPIYKPLLSVLESYCLRKTLLSLSRRDVYFVAPEGLDVTNFREYPCEILFFNRDVFASVESYSRWLLTNDLYLRFSAYEKLLICQIDAIVLGDDLDKWSDACWDYVGAPWWGSVSYRPAFSVCHPELIGKTYLLQVGNGGLSLRNPRKIISLLSRNREFIEELLLGHGAQVNEDAIFAILGLVDLSFKIPDCHEAAKFSLELNARENIVSSGLLPMGFHALHKHDPYLFEILFPDLKL